jgi:hypothetical protein
MEKGQRNHGHCRSCLLDVGLCADKGGKGKTGKSKSRHNDLMFVFWYTNVLPEAAIRFSNMGFKSN